MNTDQITYWIIDELHGDISPEDAALLQKALEDYPEAVKLRNDLRKLLTEGEMQGVVGKKIPLKRAITEMSKGVQQENEKNKPVKRNFNTLLVLLLVTCTAIYWYLRYQRNLLRQHTVSWTVPVYKKPVIILKDSTVIGLDTIGHYGNDGISANKQHTRFEISGPIRNIDEGTIITPPGKDFTFRLPDKTVVRLNGQTYYKTSFSHTAPREAFVNGEAYVITAPDANRPFTINLPDGQIQVLGTEFNINTYQQDHIQVALVAGSVIVKNNKRSVTLQPDSSAAWKQHTAIQIAPFNKKEVLSWLKGEYAFSSITFRELIPIIRRSHGLEIVLDATAASDTLRFSGISIRGGSIETFFRENIYPQALPKYSFIYETDTIFISSYHAQKESQ